MKAYNIFIVFNYVLGNPACKTIKLRAPNAGRALIKAIEKMQKDFGDSVNIRKTTTELI